jgi:hypothetical protein
MKINKLQEKIKNIKTFFYSIVGGQFKKRRHEDCTDIYCEELRFKKKCFFYKLKRIIMNFIFKLFEKVLETYFIEIEFYSGS